MSINLTNSATHALNRAAARADSEDLQEVFPRHILAGVLTEFDEYVEAWCDNVGLSTDSLPEGVIGGEQTFGGHLPFSPESHEVLTAAVEFGEESGHPFLTGLHLLVGIARRGDDWARTTLESWSGPGASLETEADRVLSAETEAEPQD